MDKIKDMLHGHKKDDEHAHATPATATTTNVGTAEAGYSDPATTHHEEGKEKKGFLGLGGHKKVLSLHISFIMYSTFAIVDGSDMDYSLSIMCTPTFMLFFNGLNSDAMSRIPWF